MAEPQFWAGLCILFVIAGLVHLARASRPTDRRRRVRALLGISCMVWALAAWLIRFGPGTAAYISIGVAAALMLAAAFVSARQSQ